MNDEQWQRLSAYVDGELGPEQRRAVREWLETDTDARACVEQLSNLNRKLETAFDPIARAPLPAALQDLLAPAPVRWRQWMMPAALAASLALIAVLLLRIHTLDDAMQGQLAQIQAQMALLRAQTLENVPSGNVASWSVPARDARIEVKPVRTYRTPDQRFCREYEERVEEAGEVEIRKGIACRTGKAKWSDMKQEVF